MHIFESKHSTHKTKPDFQLSLFPYKTAKIREPMTFVQNTWQLIHGGYHYNLNRLFFPPQKTLLPVTVGKARIHIKVNNKCSDLRAPLLWKLLSEHTRRHTKKMSRLHSDIHNNIMCPEFNRKFDSESAILHVEVQVCFTGCYLGHMSLPVVSWPRLWPLLSGWSEPTASLDSP